MTKFLRKNRFSPAKQMKIDNIRYHKDYIELELNPKIYPIDTVFSAAYVLMDRAYVIIDGDPKKTLLVRLRPKNSCSLKKLAHEFNDELLNYVVYDAQCRRNSGLREELLKRALITNISQPDRAEGAGETDETDYLDDAEDILVPWEEKYGKES